MNRKKKINDLYKGVFKNDKKGCLVDLKPLDNKPETNHPNSPSKQNNQPNMHRNDKIKHNQNNYPKEIDIRLKVAKNLGFGTYFKNLREEIVDVFIGKEELISFEGMFNQKDVSDLFNFKESIQKTASDHQCQGKMRSSLTNNYTTNNNTNNTSFLNQLNQSTNSTDQEVILYEDEEKTIYKRKKIKSKITKEYDQENINKFIPVAKKENAINVNQGNNNAFCFFPDQNTNTNINSNSNVNMNMFYPINNNHLNDNYEIGMGMGMGMFTPDKTNMDLGNNYTKNSILFMNKISNCRNINGNYVSIPNINHN